MIRFNSLEVVSFRFNRLRVSGFKGRGDAGGTGGLLYCDVYIIST